MDIKRIGLWGTSFAGGHVLVTAAKEGTNVTAVVSQVGSLHPQFPTAYLLTLSHQVSARGINLPLTPTT